MSEPILLWNDLVMEEGKAAPSVTPYLLPGDAPRPAVLVIPGGGYGGVCHSTEGKPIAEAFNRRGLHAFVLHYRTAPHAFPAPLADAVRAMRLIRGRASEWRVLPREIAACGFSAGGHLAGALGIYSEEAAGAAAGGAYDEVDPRPDALILSYPVVSFAPWSNTTTARNFCGGIPTEADIARFSLEKRVSDKTPPVFLWHTVRDQIVDYHNSVVLAEAMAKAGRPCELHLFPYGDHGMLEGLDTADVSAWPDLAVDFLRTCRASAETGFRERYTNAYQAAAQRRRQEA